MQSDYRCFCLSKIITHQEISEEIYHKIKNEILEELECHVDENPQDKRKNNR